MKRFFLDIIDSGEMQDLALVLKGLGQSIVGHRLDRQLHLGSQSRHSTCRLAHDHVGGFDAQ